MSWRGTADVQTQRDLDSLLDNSIEAAAHKLGRGESLNPFSLAIGIGGERTMRVLDPSLGSTDEATILRRLTLADDHDQLRARAIAFDVRVTWPMATDALKIVSEHRDGHAIDILVPYISRDEVFMLDTDAMSASVGTSVLWVPRARPSGPETA